MATFKTIAVIGAGKMGEALIAGLLKYGSIKPKQLCAAEADEFRRQYITKAYDVKCYEEAAKAVKECDIAFIAVKPSDMKTVLENIREALNPSKVLVTFAAGVQLDYVKQIVGENVPTLRAMPNLACQVGEGMISLSASPNVGENIRRDVEVLLRRVGKVIRVPEKLLDPATAIAGSGPAYVYLMIETIADAAVRLGFDRQTAIGMVAQVFLGSSKIVLETQEHPAKLRDMVTTPSGTTAEALYILERGGIRALFIDAVMKATDRAHELALQ
ncbi:MAG: pyrroline-5-carboxylate reductase [Candidatus Bathyarchaeia archaeon]